MAFYVTRPGGNRKASGRADLRTKGLPTAGSAITGALAGGSCSTSKKDVAQERLQVSISLKPGICWVSVYRNGPLLFFLPILREDGFYPLHSNIKQDCNNRPFSSSSWKPPRKVLWHRLAPNQGRQHQSRRVSSFEIIIQWLRKHHQSGAPAPVRGGTGLNLLRCVHLISVDSFLFLSGKQSELVPFQSFSFGK